MITNTITKKIEEIKNKQTEMNNTITEIKNTLKGTNSRITEAEKWISELKDRMVEIIAEEPNKGKGMKRLEESLRDLWDNIKCTNIWVIRVPEEEETKERQWENFWINYSWKLSQHMKGNSQSSPRGTESPLQVKPKEKHIEIHINKANRD